MDYRDCDLVESLPGRMSGVPVVRGTRGASPRRVMEHSAIERSVWESPPKPKLNRSLE